MEQIFTQGSILIKKHPKLLNKDEREKIAYDLKFHQEHSALFNTNDITGIKEEQDYSGMDSFYLLYVVNNKYYLVKTSKNSQEVQNFEIDFQTLCRDYMPLEKFLKTAEFVGRFAKKFPDNKDHSFTDGESIILYKQDWCTLIRTKEPATSKYEYRMLSPFYTKDKKWGVFGDVKSEYHNYSKVYKDIYDQIVSWDKDMGVDHKKSKK